MARVALDPFQRIVNVGWSKLFLGVYAAAITGNNSVDPNATVTVGFGPRVIIDGLDNLGIEAPHIIDSHDLAQDSFLISRINLDPTFHFSSNVQSTYLASLVGQTEFEFTLDIVSHEALTNVDFSVFITDSSMIQNENLQLALNASGNVLSFFDSVGDTTVHTESRSFRVNVAEKSIVQI